MFTNFKSVSVKLHLYREIVSYYSYRNFTYMYYFPRYHTKLGFNIKNIYYGDLKLDISKFLRLKFKLFKKYTKVVFLTRIVLTLRSHKTHENLK